MGYNFKIDKIQMNTVAVGAAGKIYTDTVQQETVRSEVKVVPVTVHRFIKAVYEHFCHKRGIDLIANRKTDQNSNNDSLQRYKAALVGDDQQAGRSCYCYGEECHLDRECPEGT